MVGFWDEVNCSEARGAGRAGGAGEDSLGPNMRFNNGDELEWAQEMKLNTGGTDLGGSKDEDIWRIEKVWEGIKEGEEDDFEEYHDADVGFTGRFFLRTEGADEIDFEVLQGMGGAGDTKNNNNDALESESESDSEGRSSKKSKKC